MLNIKTLNTAKLRKALQNAFDDSDFSALCLDYFAEVYDKFSQGMRYDDKITLLLEHYRRRPTGFQSLLDIVRQEYKESNFLRKELVPLINALERLRALSPVRSEPTKEEITIAVEPSRPQVIVRWQSDRNKQRDRGEKVVTLPCTIGRSPESTVLLKNKHVSRHHVNIEWQDNQVLLTNNSEKGKTCVNGKPLVQGEQAVVKPSSQVKLGTHTLMIEPIELEDHGTIPVVDKPGDRPPPYNEKSQAKSTFTPPSLPDTFKKRVTPIRELKSELLYRCAWAGWWIGGLIGGSIGGWIGRLAGGEGGQLVGWVIGFFAGLTIGFLSNLLREHLV